MKRVHAVVVVAVEYDTVQEVSEISIETRMGQNLLARGYTVNDVKVTKWLAENTLIERPPHQRRRLES